MQTSLEIFLSQAKPLLENYNFKELPISTNQIYKAHNNEFETTIQITSSPKEGYVDILLDGRFNSYSCIDATDAHGTFERIMHQFHN